MYGTKSNSAMAMLRFTQLLTTSDMAQLASKDTIFYIQQAVQLNTCQKRTRYGPYNYLTGHTRCR